MSTATKPQLCQRPPANLLSLVFPIYNEQEMIPFLRQEIERWRPTVQVPIEVIAVDDGSSDASLAMLAEWASTDRTIKVVSFSTNFGHQAAVTAGLEASAGDAIAILDADLQDPLDVVPEMLARYQQGYDVIYGKRISREGETPFKRASAWLFYRLMRRFVHPKLPSDTGDFRLVSRRCLDAVLRMQESHRFLRGMFAWVGFHQIELPYRRLPRRHGVTKYPLPKMLRFAWNAALSFSVVPIRFITCIGLGTAAFGFGYGVYSVLRRILWKDTVQGWTTLVVLLALVGGAILVSLGILGEYVARIYEEVKRRPLYVVRDRLNLDGPPSGRANDRTRPIHPTAMSQ